MVTLITQTEEKETKFILWALFPKLIYFKIATGLRKWHHTRGLGISSNILAYLLAARVNTKNNTNNETPNAFTQYS